MKVLVYGSKGWIGEQFIQILKNKNISFVEGKSRVDNDKKLSLEIDDVKPTHIVSFIGRTHGKISAEESDTGMEKIFTTIDYLEQKGKLYENVRDNLYSPLLLSILSKERNIHFTYLGTGCIFKYDDEHPYGQEIDGFTEESLPNFFESGYSTVKGFTDRLMHYFDKNVLNLRIRMPITGNQNGRNFITKITTYDKICSIPNSMTVLPELLPIALEMLKKNISGTYNFTNPGLISHNEILEMFKEIVDPEFTWNNFTIEEQNKILAGGRSNNFLETKKLESLDLGEEFKVKNIKESVREQIINYKPTYKKKKNINNNQNEKSSNYINLLVTGGCGFIGSNFINYKLDKSREDNQKYRIINFDAMYYCANENNVNKEIRESDNYILIKENLIRKEAIKEVLEKYEITEVIHFAAQSHVQNSFEDSLQFTQDNVLGTHMLLETCRKYGKIKKFIHVSTDEVYGESMNQVDEKQKTEHSILCPTNPYAATKAGAELIAQSYNHSYNMPIIITRGNNVYGPNQYPEKLIPKFLKLLNENKKLTIQGDGSAVRAFLHAHDTARAFECILEKGKIGEIYNIGCDDKMEFSVMEIAKLLIKLVKNTDNFDEWIEYIEDRPFNDQRYYISNQKLKNLGWDVKIGLLDGINNLINIKNNNIST